MQTIKFKYKLFKCNYVNPIDNANVNGLKHVEFLTQKKYTIIKWDPHAVGPSKEREKK